VSAVAGALHVVEHNALVFRRVWRGSIMVSFFTPLFFLGAMGLGLGSFVNRGAGGVGGVPYVDFLAPGLIAAATMQTAAFECMYPILGKIMWDRIYDAMLATPIRVVDLLAGEVCWVLVRVLIVGSLFWIVMVLFGVAHTAESLLVIPAAALSGLAFATPILAFTAVQRNHEGFASIGRFVITPLFLLGGAFFPLSKLPLFLQAVAWATPLAHGVALCRGLVLGALVPGDALLHTTVIAAYFAGGFVLARATFLRRLAN
jgi:lipooligosaccharide transport system permease protein